MPFPRRHRSELSPSDLLYSAGKISASFWKRFSWFSLHKTTFRPCREYPSGLKRKNYACRHPRNPTIHFQPAIRDKRHNHSLFSNQAPVLFSESIPTWWDFRRKLPWTVLAKPVFLSRTALHFSSSKPATQDNWKHSVSTLLSVMCPPSVDRQPAGINNNRDWMQRHSSSKNGEAL